MSILSLLEDHTIVPPGAPRYKRLDLMGAVIKGYLKGDEWGHLAADIEDSNPEVGEVSPGSLSVYAVSLRKYLRDYLADNIQAGLIAGRYGLSVDDLRAFVIGRPSNPVKAPTRQINRILDSGVTDPRDVFGAMIEWARQEGDEIRFNPRRLQALVAKARNARGLTRKQFTWTAEHIGRLKEMMRNRIPVKQIAKEFNISERAVTARIQYLRAQAKS